MTALKKIILAAFLLFSFSPLGRCVQVKPSLSYEYTTGSGDYYSHSGTGGIGFKFERVKLLANLTLFSDSDYSLIRTGTFRIRGALDRDDELSAALLVSGGKLRDSNTSTSSTALDLEGSRYFTEQFFGTLGYRYTAGSLASGINREVRVTQGRRTRTEIVQEELASNYTAHTLSTTAGYDFAGPLRWFSPDIRLAATFNSDQSTVYSESIEPLIRLPYEFYFGLSYTLTQSTKGTDRNYFSISLSKYF